jgi:hypothetical protein
MAAAAFSGGLGRQECRLRAELPAPQPKLKWHWPQERLLA